MISMKTMLTSMRVHSGSIKSLSSTATRSSSTLETLMVPSPPMVPADGFNSLTGPSRSPGLLGTPMVKSPASSLVTKVSTFQLFTALATWLPSGNARKSLSLS